jgi:hypothetical protein
MSGLDLVGMQNFVVRGAFQMGGHKGARIEAGLNHPLNFGGNAVGIRQRHSFRK